MPSNSIVSFRPTVSLSHLSTGRLGRHVGFASRGISTSPRTISVSRWIVAWFAVIGLGARVTLAAYAAASVAGPAPNVVVFLVDDYGWQDTSVSFWTEQTLQNRHFHTPSLERLAARGVRFTNGYACTVCTPTRISLMTGLNAARHRVTNWTLKTDQETSGATPRLSAPREWLRAGIPPGEVTLPTLLRDHLGYRTIHVGKAHWGALGTAGADPTHLGFDVNIGGHAAGAPGHYHGEQNYGNQAAGQLTPPWGVPGLEAYHGTETHLTDALTQEALTAVRAAVAAEQPFYLYLAHYAVHTPIQSHPRFLSRYLNVNYPGTDVPIPAIEANYASMVEGIDASLGTLLDELQRLKIADNTLIVFLSDNGGLSRHARDTTPHGTGRDSHNWPLREGKGSAYEGGTRVPMVLAWAAEGPSVAQQQLPLPAQTTQNAPVIVEDLFPTLLRVARGTHLLDTIPPRDGRDLTPLFSGDTSAAAAAFATRPLVFHYPHQWSGLVEGGYQPHSALRVGPWKAIYFYEGQRWELYHLDNDLSELKNLAAGEPVRLAALATQLETLLHERGAAWPHNRFLHVDEPLRRPDQIDYPDTTWAVTSPAAAGLDDQRLRQIAEYLGGRGIITYDGREVFSWGEVSRAADVASAVKPLFSHFLAHAVANGQLVSFEQPLVKYQPGLALLNPELDHKDKLITFRHCANQTSCYGVAEPPGQAFDYNDFQMALFFDTLFNQVYNVATSSIDREVLTPLLMQPLQCQDRPSLLALGDSERAGRLRISPRDFCRFGLLYLHDGTWRDKQLLPPDLARSLTHSPLSTKIPRTQGVAAEMLPDQRSLGSTRIPDDQTDHFGAYSWAWWVNSPRREGTPLWPAAPTDTFACLGHRHGKRGMAVIPAWRIVCSWNDSSLDERAWDRQDQDPHPLNVVFELLTPHVDTSELNHR